MLGRRLTCFVTHFAPRARLQNTIRHRFAKHTPRIGDYELPLLESRGDPHKLDSTIIARHLLENYPGGAEWHMVLDVVKFMGYHTDCEDPQIWKGLAKQVERALTTELKLDQPKPKDMEEDAWKKRHAEVEEQLSFVIECFLATPRRCPVLLRQLFARIVTAQAELGVLSPNVCARLYASFTQKALRQDPKLTQALLASITQQAKLMNVYYATVALRTIQTQQQDPAVKLPAEVLEAKAELELRYNRKILFSPRGYRKRRRHVVLPKEALQAGEITDLMRERLKPEVVAMLEKAKEEGVQDLTPLVYKYPTESSGRKKWYLRYGRHKRIVPAHKQKKKKIPMPMAS